MNRLISIAFHGDIFYINIRKYVSFSWFIPMCFCSCITMRINYSYAYDIHNNNFTFKKVLGDGNESVFWTKIKRRRTRVKFDQKPRVKKIRTDLNSSSRTSEKYTCCFQNTSGRRRRRYRRSGLRDLGAGKIPTADIGYYFRENIFRHNGHIARHRGPQAAASRRVSSTRGGSRAKISRRFW